MPIPRPSFGSRQLVGAEAMLTISRTQMEALSRAFVESFRERAAAHVAKAFPEAAACLGDSSVHASVDEAIAQAGKYGIETEFDIVRFLNLIYRLGFAFYKDPKHDWAVALLTDPQNPPGQRLELVFAQLRFRAGPRGR
jgi:hypothetical protein